MRLECSFRKAKAARHRGCFYVHGTRRRSTGRFRGCERKNAEGAAIYIRPHGEHPYSLIDDLSAEGVRRLKAEGFTPAIVVETSPGNFQAWLHHGETLDKRTSTAAARALAEKFGGDRGAADWRHFGRLAGFTNRKPRYRQADGLYPFVRVTERNSCGVFPRASSFLAGIRPLLRQEGPPRSSAALHPRSNINVPFKTIDDFRADPSYAGDGNRIDLAFAVYALAHGHTEDSVRAAILTRDLTKKGAEARQNAYVTRTVSKALDHLLGAGPRRTNATER